MKRTIFDRLDGRKLILGLIHLKPMPGTPFYEDGNLETSLKKAISDAKALQNGGADGCLLQSVDGIYGAEDDTDYARVATLAMIAARVRDATGPDFKIGVQLMFTCITPSLAVAKACLLYTSSFPGIYPDRGVGHERVCRRADGVDQRDSGRDGAAGRFQSAVWPYTAKNDPAQFRVEKTNGKRRGKGAWSGKRKSADRQWG